MLQTFQIGEAVPVKPVSGVLHIKVCAKEIDLDVQYKIFFLQNTAIKLLRTFSVITR